MTGARSPVTVLVNSTDSYRDCWHPFFVLFGRYWSDCPYPIVLNTERLEFAVAGLDVRSTRVAEVRASPENVSWSESLLIALDEADTDLILYLQEDYFLHGPVREDVLRALAARMAAEAIDCIQLLPLPNAGPWVERADDLWEVDRGSPYRLNLQAGLWRVQALRSVIRRHEDPWQFEVLGSKRRSARRLRVFAVNRDRFMIPATEVMPYRPTGVVKGRWNRDVVEALFRSEGIEVDYAARGFMDEPGLRVVRRSLRQRVWHRVRSL